MQAGKESPLPIRRRTTADLLGPDNYFTKTLHNRLRWQGIIAKPTKSYKVHEQTRLVSHWHVDDVHSRGSGRARCG